MLIALFVVAALVVLVGVALVITVLADRRALLRPTARDNGLRDDLTLGIGLNNFGS